MPNAEDDSFAAILFGFGTTPGIMADGFRAYIPQCGDCFDGSCAWMEASTESTEAGDDENHEVVWL